MYMNHMHSSPSAMPQKNYKLVSEMGALLYLLSGGGVLILNYFTLNPIALVVPFF